MKGYKFEWRFGLKNSVFQPSFRSKFLCIFSPDRRHSSHGIGHVIHIISFFHSISIRQNIICLCTSPILLLTKIEIFISIYKFIFTKKKKRYLIERQKKKKISLVCKILCLPRGLQGTVLRFLSKLHEDNAFSQVFHLLILQRSHQCWFHSFDRL